MNLLAAVRTCILHFEYAKTYLYICTFIFHLIRVTKIFSIISEKDWVWRRRVNMAASAAETRKSKMKSASYGDVVIETFKELKQNDELCDYTVSSEGKSIKVDT